jgi:DNA-binding NarL/FixJ family response regulator
VAGNESPEFTFQPLSTREMEILKCITRGQSNKEIAKLLGISRQTVKNHMTSILRKLAVNDRTQAAVYALRRGWIRLQDAR